MKKSWSFYADSAAGFHYFVDSSNNVTHQYTAQAGAPTSIKLERAGGGMFGDGDTVTFESGYPIKYGKSIGTELGTVTTGESGSASITFDNAGTYYVWCDGAEGIDAGVGDIVSSPASAAVIVSGDTDDSEDSAAYQPISNSDNAYGVSLPEWSVNVERANETGVINIMYAPAVQAGHGADNYCRCGIRR